MRPLARIEQQVIRVLLLVLSYTPEVMLGPICVFHFGKLMDDCTSAHILPSIMHPTHDCKDNNQDVQMFSQERRAEGQKALSFLA